MRHGDDGRARSWWALRRRSYPKAVELKFASDDCHLRRCCGDERSESCGRERLHDAASLSLNAQKTNPGAAALPTKGTGIVHLGPPKPNGELDKRTSPWACPGLVLAPWAGYLVISDHRGGNPASSTLGLPRRRTSRVPGNPAILHLTRPWQTGIRGITQRAPRTQPAR